MWHLLGMRCRIKTEDAVDISREIRHKEIMGRKKARKNAEVLGDIYVHYKRNYQGEEIREEELFRH